MENSPELQAKAKYLGSISSDFARLAPLLKEAAYELRARKISNFPIFALAKTEIKIGQLLVAAPKPSSWHCYFTFLEELLAAKVIAAYREEAFIRTYKNPEEYACLLVVERDFLNFVYLPYPEETE